MPTFAWILIVSGALIVPIIASAYLVLRIRGRRIQLKNLFSLEGILDRYLAARGRNPGRSPKETREQHRRRLQDDFALVFSREFEREYSLTSYWVSILMASLMTAGAITFLVAHAFGAPLFPKPPLPVLYALLGAVFWSVWVMVRGYARSDLTPSTFYGMAFRYVLALAYGLLAKEVFSEGLGALGAFVATTLPFSEAVKILRSKLATQLKSWTPVEGYPKLSEIQGLDSSTIERFDEVGIHTTQELAHSDPLDLLLRANFSPKILIDWMDQAFLYNYVGDKLTELRPCGIRGAIELASLQDEPKEARQSIAKVLGVADRDVSNLIQNLYLDNQLRLIWEMWGVFEERTEEGVNDEAHERSDDIGKAAAPAAPQGSPVAEEAPATGADEEAATATTTTPTAPNHRTDHAFGGAHTKPRRKRGTRADRARHPPG